MTSAEKTQLLQEAIATLAIENQPLTDEQIAFFENAIEKELTTDQIGALINARHNVVSLSDAAE